MYHSRYTGDEVWPSQAMVKRLKGSGLGKSHSLEKQMEEKINSITFNI
jgi:hypothetical protein